MADEWLEAIEEYRAKYNTRKEDFQDGCPSGISEEKQRADIQSRPAELNLKAHKNGLDKYYRRKRLGCQGI